MAPGRCLAIRIRAQGGGGINISKGAKYFTSSLEIFDPGDQIFRGSKYSVTPHTISVKFHRACVGDMESVVRLNRSGRDPIDILPSQVSSASLARLFSVSCYTHLETHGQRYEHVFVHTTYV